MSAPHDDQLRSVTLASVVVATVLIAAKLIAWLAADAVSLLASLVDSSTDLLASLITFSAVRLALQPPDDEHRFGHGKAEGLAALAQATFVAGSAVFLLLQGVERFFRPAASGPQGPALAAMALSILLTLGLVAYQWRVVRATGSTAIKADSLHYSADLAANLVVIGALLATASGWAWVDPVVALGLGAFILHGAAGVGREAIDLLMDREAPPEVRAQVLAAAFAPSTVRGVHDLRTRQSGRTLFVELHLELDDALSLHEAHEATEAVERRLLREFPGAQVLIHPDPVGVVDPSRVRREQRPTADPP